MTEQKRIDQSIRLKQLIKALNLNQPSFSKSLGMTQPNISRMISGRSSISVEILNRITDRYKQVNLHWLLTGEGVMFLGEEPQEKEGDVLVVKARGRLEELEERLERVEEVLRRVVEGMEKDGLAK